MKAMLLEQISHVQAGSSPLRLADLPVPEPAPGEVLVKISACGVCHTELDEIEGRTPPPLFPIIPGHQIVGTVEQVGDNVAGHRVGQRVGIAWIYSSCGTCSWCRSGDENLCPEFRATGRDVHGGYAEYVTVPQDFAFPIPHQYGDIEVAPLLCAGAIGYRSLRLTQTVDGDAVGLMGFGASAHLVLKMINATLPCTRTYVFARNPAERAFARELGAVWAGDISDRSPEQLQSIIDTTPAWKPILESLKNLQPGGRLVINAIRKEETDKSILEEIDYPSQLWMEKEIKSVANVAKRDVSEFLELAASIAIRPEVQCFELHQANIALTELKAGKIRGAKVLVVNP